MMYINVLEYLEASAEKFPDKIAFSDSTNEITYRDLAAQAKALGSYIYAQTGGVAKRPVLIWIDRDIKSLIAFLGVVYSGNFYVPMDRQIPLERIEAILRALQPAAAVVPKDDAHVLSGVGFDEQLVTMEAALAVSIDEDALGRVRRAAIDTDPLYAIFTSGSTGVPKGVVVCHRSVIDLIERFVEVFGFSEQSVFGNQAPFDFDVSVKDIYSTLKNGATMHVIPKMLFSFPLKLIEHLNIRRINTVIWAASAMRIVANLKVLEKQKPLYLKLIMFSGEVMPIKVLNYWRRHLPDAIYVNLYGPTEITCNCTYYIVDRPFDDSEVLPIGKPFPNTDIMILDEKGRAVGRGETGEICVRGTSLALGYYNSPEKTAEAFCQNPLNTFYPELIYRTGDNGRYNERGELMFLSRRDNQIKHMGHRIELGEIEVAVNALTFIDAACCLYDADGEMIVLCYQAADKCDREILLGIRNRLFKYMLPNRLLHFNELPMNKNAKIDRNLLKKMIRDEQADRKSGRELV